ncbi:MAG: DMT family transporter [Pseudomonadota bacterium]
MKPAPSVLPIEDRRLLGIGLMLVAFFCFTGIDTAAKWMVTRGIPVAEAVFIRYLGHFVIVLAMTLPAMGWRVARSDKPILTVGRAVVLMLSTACNFAALQYLPLSLTIAIFFASPLIVCALSIPMLGETVGWRRWAAICVGFIGVLIVVRPGVSEVHWAVLFSFGAVTCASIYFVLTRMAAGRETTEVQQFYVAGVATLCFLPFALADWSWPRGVDWIAFMVIGIFGWAGHQCLTIAHRFAPASALAPFIYLQILFMVASGWIVFESVPDLWVLTGAGVVMASGLYIWLREREIAGQS